MSIPADHPPGTPGYLNTSIVRASLHTGTHMDAFFHFYNDRATIDRIPLAQCIGPALLLDLAYSGPKRRLPRMIWRPIGNCSAARRR